VYKAVFQRIQRSLLAVGRFAAFLADAGAALRDVGIWVSLTAVQMRRIGVQSVPIAIFIAVFT
jgi:ABC-type transporter Mla maintaining outer membrane lipid asymmetry permease subunit MlaE